MDAIKTCMVQAAVGAIAVSGLVTYGAGSAAALSSLDCGTTITRSTKLHADLVDCPGDGIVIGAAGVTLDLNGHSVDGDGVEGATQSDAGVRNDGYPGVSIIGGTVQEFDNGVELRGVQSNVVRGPVARGNFVGIALFDGIGDNRIERTDSAGNALGILVRSSAGTTIRHNKATGSQFVGILGLEVTRTVLTDNTVLGTDLAGDGISLDANSSDNLIEHNSVSASELPLSVTGDRNIVRRNRVSSNRGGLIIIGNDNSATGNVITDAAGCGPDGGCGTGISVEGGDRNVIDSNRVSRTFDSGMRVDAYAGPAIGTVFVDNVIERAGKKGVAIGNDAVGPVEQTHVETNTVTMSATAGFDVDDATATLTGNVARRNGGLGIDAVTGVIDGGANRASGNGDPAQCTPNIAC